MTKQESIKYFGGIKQLAHALKVWPQTIYSWKGDIPSRKNQIKIHELSGGKLEITPVEKKQRKK